jgi:hypothetical protein
MKERAQRLGVPERMIEGMSNGGVRIGERGEKLGPVDDPRFTLGVAGPALAGSVGCRLARQKRRQRFINPVWLWCTWYRIAVERAPRKYHKPLTNTVSYGQLLTVENGR